jgi:pilus assembly protein Flp/PilA
MSNFFTAVRTFVADENGVTAIEYGLIAALIGVAAAATAATVGDNLQKVFTYVASKLTAPAA